jgi:integrase/recombinase XerC
VLKSGYKLYETLVYRVINKYFSEVSTKVKKSPHILRHTFATLMLEGGCNLYALSQMMGHSDIKTTTIYLGASKAHLEEQMGMHPINF